MTAPFRFGLVAAPAGSGAGWPALAQRAADLGYASLLVPDGLQLLAPFPALATAAAAADIRVGTHVLAAPLRPAVSAAWEGHSMTVLTGGRFEFGIGTGRPAVAEQARRLGVPFGTGAERLQRVRDTISALREFDGDGIRTPVLVAAGGPRARALAAELADIVTIAADALTPPEEFAAAVVDLRRLAGGRADAVEVMTNLFVVGDRMPPGAERWLGADAAGLRAAGSLAVLAGSVPAMCDELQRRRERYGTTYVTAPADAAEVLAPVVERLAGT